MRLGNNFFYSPTRDGVKRPYLFSFHALGYFFISTTLLFLQPVSKIHTTSSAHGTTIGQGVSGRRYRCRRVMVDSFDVGYDPGSQDP